MNFHFFNVENGLDVRGMAAKPNLTQYGPYAYREVRRKENLTHGGANSLYYNNYYSYVFDQEKTNDLRCYNGKGNSCSDQDSISVLNPIIAMIGPLLPELGDKICGLLPFIQEEGQIFKLCSAALSKVVEEQMAPAINEKLNGTQSAKDDLIFNTTVDEILYQVYEARLYV